jgi:hypothetical protein
MISVMSVYEAVSKMIYKASEELKNAFVDCIVDNSDFAIWRLYRAWLKQQIENDIFHTEELEKYL